MSIPLPNSSFSIFPQGTYGVSMTITLRVTRTAQTLAEDRVLTWTWSRASSPHLLDPTLPLPIFGSSVPT